MRKSGLISFLLILSLLSKGQEVDLAVQKGHSDVINLLEFSSSGQFLASRAVNNEVIVWDTKLSKTLGSFNISQTENVLGMKFIDREGTLKIKTDFTTYEYDIRKSELSQGPDPDTLYRDKTHYFDEEENYNIYLDEGGAIKKKRRDKRFRKYKLAVNYLHAPFAAFDIHKEKNLIIGVAADEKTYVYNYKNGFRMTVLEGHNSAIKDVRFTKDGKYFATAGKDRSIIIWRTRDFKIEKRLYSNVFKKKTATFSQDGHRIYVGDELGYIYGIDMNAVFPQISVTQPNLHSVNKIVCAPDGKGYYIATSNNYIYYKTNLSQKKPLAKYAFRDHSVMEAKKIMLQSWFDVYTEPFGEVNTLEFSPDNKKIAYTGHSDIPNVTFADIEKGKERHLYNYYLFDSNQGEEWDQWKDVGWLTNNHFISLLESSNVFYHWDISHKRKIKVKTDTLPFVVHDFEPLDTQNVWINARGHGQLIYNVHNRGLDKQLDEQGEAIFRYKNYMIISNTRHEIIFWDLSTGQVVHKFKGHNEKVNDVSFHPDGDHFLTASDDGTVKLWSFKRKKLIVSIIPFRNEEFVFITKDNHYLITKGALNEIGFKKEGHFFYPEQFDLKYNRPDLVLEEMGFSDDELIKAYYKAYKKRLRKMNFTEEQLSADFQLPKAEIVNINAIPASTDKSTLDLHLKFSDAKYKLDRINIWVNEVAIKGKDGINLREENVSSYEGNFTIDLAKGVNKIEVSVLNQKGVESYKQAAEIESQVGKSKPNLYLVSIGVSEFQDSGYNLDYAAKDAEDICKVFEGNTYFGEIKTKSFTNEEVTLERLPEIKNFIDLAGINDMVIVFVAGHGVLDDDFNYFFASHDMDFLNPEKRGIPYEEVEGLVDGIRALKKLLFLDTCHSGEVDKEDLEKQTTPTEEGEDIQFRSVGVNVRYRDELTDGGGDDDKGKFGLQSINELMKTVFADLRRGTGATVISSSGGAELSIESGAYKNGLFTYCLINGLTHKLADLNKDRHIEVAELQRYIRDEVTRLSNGKQTPTSRITNDELNYRLW